MERLLLLPADTYEIFAYCDQAQSFALGAQADVGGLSQQNLVNLWPPDTHPAHDYSAHVWHSAEFRSDNMAQHTFWNALLGSQGFNLK